MHSSQMTPVRDWNEIRRLRRQLEQHLHELPEEPRRDLAMVAAELTENGLRHAEPDGGEHCVTVEVDYAPARFVELRVTSYLKSSQRALNVLQRVQKIEAAEDKERAYLERLIELSRGDGSSTSELGFHRVAMEGRCSLQAAHLGDRLIICARRAL